MKKVLLTDKPKIGALSEFIKLLSELQNEFNLQTVMIDSTSDNSRNMKAQLQGELGVIVLEYDYYNEKFYISTLNNEEFKSNIEALKKLVKCFVEK